MASRFGCDPARAGAFFVRFLPRIVSRSGIYGAETIFSGWESGRRISAVVQPPWNGQTTTRGMEFGASPFPETRREMIERGRMFDTAAFRWIPAASAVNVEYWIVARTADCIPESLDRPAI